MDTEVRNGDWQTWRKYVIETLELIRQDQKQIQQDQREYQAAVTKLTVELAVLKVKAGIWGSMAGLLAAASVAIADFLLKK